MECRRRNRAFDEFRWSLSILSAQHTSVKQSEGFARRRKSPRPFLPSLGILRRSDLRRWIHNSETICPAYLPANKPLTINHLTNIANVLQFFQLDRHAKPCLATMSSRHAVPCKPRGISSSRFLATLARVTLLFATVTGHLQPAHSSCFKSLYFDILAQFAPVSPLFVTVTNNMGGGGTPRTFPIPPLRYLLTLLSPTPYTHFFLSTEASCI